MKVLVIIGELQKITDKFDSAVACITDILSKLGDAQDTTVICVELKECGKYAYNDGNDVVVKDYLRSNGFNPVVRDTIRKNKTYREMLMNGGFAPYEQRVLKPRHELKYASLKILSLFVTENRDAATTYGITIPCVNETIEEKIKAFLTKNGIKFKEYVNTWNYELRISMAASNFDRYKKLADKCWQKYLTDNRSKFEHYMDLVEQVDTTLVNPNAGRTNSVVNIDSSAQSHMVNMYNNFYVFDIDTEIQAIEILLSVQNKPELVREAISKYRNGIMGNIGINNKVCVQASVLLKEEYKRIKK